MKCTGSFVSFILPAPPNIVKIVFQNFVFFPLHFSLRLQEELPFRKKRRIMVPRKKREEVDFHGAHVNKRE